MSNTGDWLIFQEDTAPRPRALWWKTSTLTNVNDQCFFYFILELRLGVKLLPDFAFCTEHENKTAQELYKESKRKLTPCAAGDYR